MPETEIKTKSKEIQIITDRVINAINLATHLHHGHVRRDEHNTPYISHLFAVAMLLKSVTNDEDVIIAGLMHDALEDVADYEYEHLEADCGQRVAKIVQGVTEIKSMPYQERKVNYLETLKLGMIESVLVSVADKLHNLKSLKDVHYSHNMNKETQILIYREVLKIGQERLINAHGEAHPLVVALESELGSFEI